MEKATFFGNQAGVHSRSFWWLLYDEMLLLCTPPLSKRRLFTLLETLTQAWAPKPKRTGAAIAFAMHAPGMHTGGRARARAGGVCVTLGNGAGTGAGGHARGMVREGRNASINATSHIQQTR